jgi:hypothetical protein
MRVYTVLLKMLCCSDITLKIHLAQAAVHEESALENEPCHAFVIGLCGERCELRAELVAIGRKVTVKELRATQICALPRAIVKRAVVKDSLRHAARREVREREVGVANTHALHVSVL